MIELILAMIIAGLLMAGMASALVIASRAADTTADAGARSAGERQAADQITADLNHATTIVSQSANSVSFTVSDRSGDSSPETIQYAWGGNTGDPVTREYNGLAAQTILENVQQFDLTWLARPSLSPPLRESAVVSLIGNQNPVGGTIDAVSVDPNHPCAQFLKPPLPQNASSWSIAAARIMMVRQTDGLTVLVEIQSASIRQKPSGQILAAVSVQTASLPPTLTWTDIGFTGVGGLDPSTGVCLVVRQISGNQGVKVQFQKGGLSMPQNTHWMTSSDAGMTWTQPTMTDDMVFEVLGTITTQGPAQWN